LTNGLGSITHTFVGSVLEIGRALFGDSGARARSGIFQLGRQCYFERATLSFLMQSNMVLQADFIANPFLPVKGVYNGLFAETVRAQNRSGFSRLR
jgi:hypothetical protein